MKNGEKNILVIKFSAMGDLILTTPALRALKTKFPDSHLVLVVARHNASLLTAWPYIDEIIPVSIPFRRGFSLSDFAEFTRFLFNLRRRRFHLVFNFQGNARSYLIEFFAHHTWGKKLLALKRILPLLFLPPGLRGRKRQKGYPVDVWLSQLQEAGVPPAGTHLEFFFHPEEKEEAKTLISDIPPSALIIGINPGVNWESKRYPEERYAEIANRLIDELGAYILIFGGPEDVEKARMVEKDIRNKDKVKNLAGKTRTLNIATAVIEHCRLFITNDSGLMHCAAAVGVPTISLFGGTHPSVHSPRGPYHFSFFGGNSLPCSPCYRYWCFNPVKRACFHAITPELVLSTAKSLLSLPSPGEPRS
ncbi:MAG: glycosyltransferase family 9 protein [bacterium JZ-2024 1]